MSAQLDSKTAPALSAPQAALLVAEREIMVSLRSKAFIISTVVMALIALAAVIWGGVSANNSIDSTVNVAVVSGTNIPVSAVDQLTVSEYPDRAGVEAAVLAEEVSAGIVPDAANPTGLLILGKTQIPDNLPIILGSLPAQEILDQNAINPMLRYFVAFGFGLIFFMAAMMFGTSIATSVVEEKQTRVVELLLSAISARTLLAGKVLGNTVLAVGQILLFAAVAVIGLTVSGQELALAGLGAPLAWFAIFFLFGFVLLAALYAAAGSMVSRQEDIGSVTTPLMFLVMAPYFLVIFFHNDPQVLSVMSYVPFSAPVGMPLRMFLNEAQWWEPILSLVILAACAALSVVVGAKIYQNSLLRMGARVKLVDALKG